MNYRQHLRGSEEDDDSPRIIEADNEKSIRSECGKYETSLVTFVENFVNPSI